MAIRNRYFLTSREHDGIQLKKKRGFFYSAPGGSGAGALEAIKGNKYEGEEVVTRREMSGLPVHCRFSLMGSTLILFLQGGES